MSLDEGLTWITALREVPGREQPVPCGNLNYSQLPPLKRGESFDFGTVLESGFGAVVGHEANQLRPFIHVSNDNGTSWTRVDIAEMAPHAIAARQNRTWTPLEQFDAMMIQLPTRIILIGSGDPWDDSWPNSHIVISNDGGHSWSYTLVEDFNSFLAQDYDGRLLASNDGYFLASRDGGASWNKEPFQIEWPASYEGKEVGLLRHVVFTSRMSGYALVVHWSGDGHWSRDSRATGVGLLATADNGSSWKHLATFPAPNFGHVNDRHCLSLHVAE
jgi:photosystem II stability/assembly factor-like uncharacterized protein